MLVYIFIGMLAGCGIAFQAAINARLRIALKSPFLSSMISFVVGTLFLLSLILYNGLSIPNFTEIAWWLWLGGFLGAVFVTTTILLFPYLGGVQTVVMPILGQILMGMLIDYFGWLHADSVPFNFLRAIGLILVILGIFCAILLADRQRHRLTPVAKSSALIWLWRLLGMIAGMFGAMQTTINGQLGKIIHSPLNAAFISFAVGTLCLLLWVLISEQKIIHRIVEAFKSDLPHWAWIGGMFGGFFVFVNAMLMPIVGTGQTVLLCLTGMILGSMIVDQFGLFNAVRKPILSIRLPAKLPTNQSND